MNTMRGAELLSWLAKLPPLARDQAIEEHLGLRGARPSPKPPGDELLGYHPSSVAPIVRAFMEAPVSAEDVVIDLGAGLGKVVLLAHLLTCAAARGVEIQPSLVARARTIAARLGAYVTYAEADARTADVDDGTVFFLYAPVSGTALAEVVRRLRRVAEKHAIVVCALGLDMTPARAGAKGYGDASWLVPRPTDAFWLTIYDSVVPGVPARGARAPAITGRDAEIVADLYLPVVRGGAAMSAASTSPPAGTSVTSAPES
jgi:hypothetical protein